MDKPRIIVLMATYNGIVWLPDQIKSILSQDNVDITLLVSDDCSSDTTYKYLSNISTSDSRVTVLPNKVKFGSAGANFLGLLKDVDVSKFDYVALSDQDDIWAENKLRSAIDAIKLNLVEGYSSNVTAFWANGVNKLISKSQAQQKYDYMFESAGPGCTFVITKNLALNLQKLLSTNQNKFNGIALHDWFIYAYARSRGYRWVIDKESHMLYRQHDKNVVGANIGIKAKLYRWKKMRDGWHMKQAILIAEILGYSNNFPIRELSNYSFLDRLKLIANIRKLRRRLRDCFALTIFFLLPLKK